MGTRDTEAEEEEKQETILVGVHVDWSHQSTRLGAGDGVFTPGPAPNQQTTLAKLLSL